MSHPHRRRGDIRHLDAVPQEGKHRFKVGVILERNGKQSFDAQVVNGIGFDEIDAWIIKLYGIDLLELRIEWCWSSPYPRR